MMASDSIKSYVLKKQFDKNHQFFLPHRKCGQIADATDKTKTSNDSSTII